MVFLARLGSLSLFPLVMFSGFLLLISHLFILAQQLRMAFDDEADGFVSDGWWGHIKAHQVAVFIFYVLVRVWLAAR